MSSLASISGVGEKRIKDFEKMGITSLEQLVCRFPRTYLDLRRQTPLSSAYHNDTVLTMGKVTVLPQSFFPMGAKKTVKAYCEQDGYPFTAMWFHQPYVLKSLKIGTEYLFYGRLQNKFGGATMVNPTFEPVDKNVKLKGIVPVYTVKGRITQKIMRDSVQRALELLPIKSVIPSELQVKYDLSDLRTAYFDVHFPSSLQSKNRAAERIALEEYFVLISAFRYIKGSREQVRINRYAVSDADILSFEKRFGFAFTEGQKQALTDIVRDLTGAGTMNRLLQGDVGSGKTAVALGGLWFAVKNGYQSAFLAPTEVLAEQNFRLVQKILPEFKSVFLSGSLSAKEKTAIKKMIASGEADIVVGTHAVIQGDVTFQNLAFCVCDEQHRFGVAQRSALTEKGEVPDVLVMSATPIPRTLSLIFYGDLDISTIKDKPLARADVQTNLVPYRKYQDMLSFIEREVQKGNRAYFVCPKIEGDEEGAIMSVTELYDELKNRLPTCRFALLHGKMKDKEKTQIMLDFKVGKTDCLVSTTVIEVGVDVPDATVMTVYNAERFGLSQLHQLRGRVGRSDKKSYCFLLTDSEDEKSLARLQVMRTTSDGFEISEYDYSARGSGDFLGTRQSGKFLTELGNLTYPVEVIFQAKALCDESIARREYAEKVRDFALKKYERLKDVILN